MVLYNVTTKLIIGTPQDIESKVSSYINGIDNSKVIRGIAVTYVGGMERVAVLIVHDA
jgi:hypothetical protein